MAKSLDDRGRGHVFSSGLMLGASFDRPAAVQTLDEIVLIIRKSTQLRFDERLPHFHFYGAEICMAAAKAGRTNYAISAFSVHNSQMNLVLPKEFYESYRVFKKISESVPPHSNDLHKGHRLRHPHVPEKTQRNLSSVYPSEGGRNCSSR